MHSEPTTASLGADEAIEMAPDGRSMPALVRGHDWSSTPLGPPANWPQGLKTTVGIVLEACQPMLIMWGPQRTCIYNDGYLPILGSKHPAGLGQPAARLWAEIWETLEPMVAEVFAGRSRWVEDMPFALAGGPTNDLRWFSFSFTPLRDDNGAVAGLLTSAMETTGKMLLERQRAAARERQRKLFEQAPGFIAVLRGPQHEFEFVNHAFYRLVGQRELIGSTVRDAFPEVEGQGFYELLDEVYRSGERYIASHVPIRLSPAPGQPAVQRYLDFVYAPTVDGSGQVTGIFVEGHDVTEAHLSQEALQSHARRQALLIELGDRLRDVQSPAELSHAAGEILGRTLGVSRAGYGTIDLTEETITIERDWNAPGIRSLAGVLHFRDYGRYIENLRRGETVVFADAEKDPRTAARAEALKAISAQSVVNMPITEDGCFVALLYLNHATAREWTDDELAFIREVGERTRAVIERRRAEQEVRELTASLERKVEERTAERDRIWENSRDLLAVVDSAGLFLRINPAWTAILGYAPESLVGQHFLQWVWPEDQTATLDAVAAGPRLTGFQNRYRHQDGTARWISWSTSAEGGLVYAYGRDVTAERQQAEALRQAQEQLLQAQKMEAVGQLTGGLAHDFNNLLAGISGSLDMMQVRVEQGRTADLQRYLGAAQDASRRAAALTHRLLAFSRRQTLDPHPVDANRLIGGMEELIRRTIGPAVTLEVDHADELWVTLADAHQLENALLNLCINARDAMPEGGQLRIGTANRWLDETSARALDLVPGDYLELSVSDTGTGMPEEVVARAFEPFFTTKPLGRGTGLGLSMIYGFAKQSGGRVQIQSRLGEGTRVSLLLPRHLGEFPVEEKQAASAGVSILPRGRTVLVVDDEPTVRMLVVDVLGEHGFTVLEACDGAAALEMLRAGMRIDLLVTDVGLPGGLNGRQLADAVRERMPRLKVLFITGFAETTVIGSGQLEPGMQVLTKPFVIDQLVARVKSLVEAGGD
ncbi:PAS domain-containing protein [Frateuria sp. GZRe14]|uniref:PAS domain-containing protein n=1 Tax=Frateuria sp. GZRe14 TaxID=3351534 RepID=UPI003EDB8239